MLNGPLSEFETILTSVDLSKLAASAAAPTSKSSKKSSATVRRFRLPKAELDRIERLLKRSVDKESGKECELELTEDNPDGRKCLLFSLTQRTMLQYTITYSSSTYEIRTVLVSTKYDSQDAPSHSIKMLLSSR